MVRGRFQEANHQWGINSTVYNLLQKANFSPLKLSHKRCPLPHKAKYAEDGFSFFSVPEAQARALKWTSAASWEFKFCWTTLVVATTSKKHDKRKFLDRVYIPIAYHLTYTSKSGHWGNRPRKLFRAFSQWYMLTISELANDHLLVSDFYVPLMNSALEDCSDWIVWLY